MKYSVEITLMNNGNGPYNIQIGEIPCGNFTLCYPKMSKIINERLKALPYAELKSGRIIANNGYIVSELELNENITTNSWKTIRPFNRKKIERNV